MNYISIKEARELGIIHEINRRLLHPVGLALEVGLTDDNEFHITGIQDWRNDAEGVFYDEVNVEKVQAYEKLVKQRKKARIKKLGYHIQPVKK